MSLHVPHLDSCLRAQGAFTILWDVRSCSLPSRQQLRIDTEWARTHEPELDKYVPMLGLDLTLTLIHTLSRTRTYP